VRDPSRDLTPGEHAAQPRRRGLLSRLLRRQTILLLVLLALAYIGMRIYTHVAGMRDAFNITITGDIYHTTRIEPSGLWFPGRIQIRFDIDADDTSGAYIKILRAEDYETLEARGLASELLTESLNADSITPLLEGFAGSRSTIDWTTLDRAGPIVLIIAPAAPSRRFSGTVRYTYRPDR